MQSDLGKLFIGGVSWDTNEEQLREYFGRYGEVIDAVIMKDRTTGRARGFGFIVFADPAIAEKVIKEKHTIDGRMVEAKKAVPRDDQSIVLSRSCNSIPGSPSSGQSRKIFVGGLASTVTEDDFKMYFEQFGTITDVVVMYDHKTQRPRGFGFITYDAVEAVDKVLMKTFHELNGKMVEVKRAIPKESSPSPMRSSPIGGYGSYVGMGRTSSSYLNGYAGTFGLRVDGVGGGRTGYPPFGIGLNFDPASYGANAAGRMLSPYYMSSRSITAGGNGGTSSLFSLSAQSLWGNIAAAAGTPDSTSYLGSETAAAVGTDGSFGVRPMNWPASLSRERSVIGLQGRNSPYSYGFDAGGGLLHPRQNSPSTANPSSSLSSSALSVLNAAASYGANPFYGDAATWRSSVGSLQDVHSPFDFAAASETSDASADNCNGGCIVGDYTASASARRQASREHMGFR